MYMNGLEIRDMRVSPEPKGIIPRAMCITKEISRRIFLYIVIMRILHMVHVNIMSVSEK